MFISSCPRGCGEEAGRYTAVQTCSARTWHTGCSTCNNHLQSEMNAKGNPSSVSWQSLVPGRQRAWRAGQELYWPAQTLAYTEDCGSSYCQPAGGTTRSRYACRCCASLARRGCSQERSRRGRNTCAAPASPAALEGEQLSGPLGNGVSCLRGKPLPLLWDGSHTPYSAVDPAAVLSATQGRTERG